MTVKAIIFDLDNTLTGFRGFKRFTARSAAGRMRRHGWRLPERETVRRIFRIYGTKGMECQKASAGPAYGAGYAGNAAERIQQSAIMAYNR